MGSKNSSAIGLTPGTLKNLSVNAKIQMLNFLNTLKVNFDFEKGTFSFGEWILGPYSSTSLTLTPPATIPATIQAAIFYLYYLCQGKPFFTHNIQILLAKNAFPWH